MSGRIISGAFILLSEGQNCYLCEVIDGQERGKKLRITKNCPRYSDYHTGILNLLENGEIATAKLEPSNENWRIKQPTTEGHQK